MPQQHFGNVHLYTGDGFGAREAALGVALRALGHGYRVQIIQFLQDNPENGESKLQQQLSPLSVVTFSRPDVTVDHPRPEDMFLAAEGLNYARRVLQSSDRPDIMILDNLNPAVYHGHLDLQDVLDFVDNTPNNVEVLLTGHPSHDALLPFCQVVTEHRRIKQVDGLGKGIAH
ncbi:MAG: cob(I)yrinic acid a,c-diamide adenosyltransferase [Candidatus Kerfeldbacteria bacterium]|nr:cob(I)yrinic acid a,c-diamide adenosyltransferase [Candidatus Kerfeldbacteria bacterium]